MPDSAHDQTELILTRTLRQLQRLYRDTDNQIHHDVDWDALYLDIEDATQRQRLRHAEKDGKLDDAVSIIVALLLLTNERAIKAINGSLDGIYRINFEDAAKQLRIDISRPGFNLDKLLDKYTKRAYRRETSHPHITKQTEKALKQALRQGNGIKDIAKNIRRVTGKSRLSAITTARTETFRIANNSRYDLFEEAAATGLNVEKTWKHEHPTKNPRDWHIAMDGETVPWDEPFSNGLMYPCEAGAPAAECINCGCGMEGRIVD